MLMLMLMSSENRRNTGTNTSVRHSTIHRTLGTRLAVGNKMADEDFSSGSHFLSYIFFLSTHAYILMLMSLLSSLLMLVLMLMLMLVLMPSENQPLRFFRA